MAATVKVPAIIAGTRHAGLATELPIAHQGRARPLETRRASRDSQGTLLNG